MSDKIRDKINAERTCPDISKSDLTSDARLIDAIDKLPTTQRDRLTVIAKDTLARQAGPSMNLSVKDDTLSIELDGNNLEITTLLEMADMGICDSDFHHGLVGQIACLGSHRRKVDSKNSNFVMLVLRSIEPRDELEAMLATQMGAIYAATMMMVRRLNHVDTIP